MKDEIKKEDFIPNILCEIEKYIKLCPTCIWFDGITCDSCDYGYPYATNNNGNRPNEVQDCNIYRSRDSHD